MFGSGAFQANGTPYGKGEKVKVKSLSPVRLFATLWTVTYQAPPSMGFSRQEYWSGLPFPSPGDLPDPGIEPGSPALHANALTSEPPGLPRKCLLNALEKAGLGTHGWPELPQRLWEACKDARWVPKAQLPGAFPSSQLPWSAPAENPRDGKGVPAALRPRSPAPQEPL